MNVFFEMLFTVMKPQLVNMFSHDAQNQITRDLKGGGICYKTMFKCFNNYKAIFTVVLDMKSNQLTTKFNLFL